MHGHFMCMCTQDNAGVNALRARQQRNMLLALMISQGTPMIVMGE